MYFLGDSVTEYDHPETGYGREFGLLEWRQYGHINTLYSVPRIYIEKRGGHFYYVLFMKIIES